MQTFTAPRPTDMDWETLREKTLGAHETPALFEEVEIDDEDDRHETFTTASGVPVGAYATELSLWEMKTGRYTPDPRSRRSLWSRIKHGVIADAMEAKGFAHIDHKPQVMLHPRLDIMASRIDALVSLDGLTWEPVIAFNLPVRKVALWHGDGGEKTPPHHVVIQAQHHMAVRRCDRVHVVALSGGVDVWSFEIAADADLVSEIEAAATDFFADVAADRQPPGNPDRDLNVLQRLAVPNKNQGTHADLTDDTELLDLVNAREAKTAEMKALKSDVQRISAKITERMTGIETARVSDHKELAWVRRKGGPVSYISKPSAHIMLRNIPKSRKTS